MRDFRRCRRRHLLRRPMPNKISLCTATRPRTRMQTQYDSVFIRRRPNTRIFVFDSRSLAPICIRIPTCVPVGDPARCSPISSRRMRLNSIGHVWTRRGYQAERSLFEEKSEQAKSWIETLDNKRQRFDSRQGIRDSICVLRDTRSA